MNAEKIYIVVNTFFKQYGRKILIFCILLYVIMFSFFSYIKYMSFSYIDVDLSIIERQFWNTIHGKLIGREIGEPAIFCGGHFFLIIFLLAPFYAIYPHPLTLLFMQTIALALPVYFIYIFARKKLDESFAFYLALAYLLYPALAYINLFEFHIIAFAPLFLIPMFVFFDRKKFWPFILLMFLSLACKEDVSLVIFGLGVYGLFKYTHLKPPFVRKKDWKWIIIPLLSGAFWLIFVTQFIQPHFTPSTLKDLSDSRGMLTFYGWLGNTPNEMIRNVVFYPGQVLRKIFTPAKGRYLLHLFGPLGFISAFGLKEIVIVLFGLLEGLLSQRSTHFSIHYQYPALLMPFIFISAIFGLRRLLQFKFFKRSKLYILIVLFSISLFFAFTIGPLFSLSFERWRRDGRDVLKEKMAKLVPPEASVATSFELATRLTHRDRLFFMFHVNMADQSPIYPFLAKQYGEKADYLLLDLLDYLTYFGFYYQDSDIYLKNFLERYNWNLVYEINNIALWTKTEENVGELIETIDVFPEQLSGPSFSNKHIKLVGQNLEKQTLLDYPVLHLDFYLECQKETNQRYILQLDFYSKGDKKLIFRHNFVAPDRIYPTKRWGEGEKIKISQNILLPDTLQIEDCKLALSFCLID